MRTSPAPRRPRRWSAAAAALLASACARADAPAEGPAGLAPTLARDRAAAFFSQGRAAQAAAALAPLVAPADARPRDLLRAWNAELARGRAQEARALGERALALAPDEPAVHWNLWRQEQLSEERSAAGLAYLRRAHELSPDDFPCELALAEALAARGLTDEAERHFLRLVARGHAFGGDWLLAAYAGYAQLLAGAGRSAEAASYEDEVARLGEAGLRAPSRARRELGSWGGVRPAPPGPAADAEAWRRLGAPLGVPPSERLVPTAVTTPEGIDGLEPAVLVDPAWSGDGFVAPGAAREDVLVHGPQGVRLARLADGALSVGAVLVDEPARLVRALDLRERGADPAAASPCELLVANDAGLWLFGSEPGSSGPWRRLHARPLVAPEFAVADAAPLDVDGDGDLDLLVAGAGGLRLLRNDAARGRLAALVDATFEAGLGRETPYRWCAAEDLDGDGDDDLLAGGGPAGSFVATNEGGGAFRERTPELPEDLRAAPVARFVDFDPDGEVDALAGLADGARLRLFASERGARWHARLIGRDAPAGVAAERLLVGDPFGEGRPWLFWPAGERGLLALRELGPTQAPETLHPGDPLAPTLARFADLDGDGTVELVESDGRGLRALRLLPSGNVARIVLRGTADNPRGVGAVVEVRAGPLYRRLRCDGSPLVIGVGRQEHLDVVRVRWPSGAEQSELDLALPGSHRIRQRVDDL